MTSRDEPSAAAAGSDRCPHLAGFGLVSQSHINDPYPALAELRRDTPVGYLPEFDLYFVSKHEHVKFMYGEPLLFSQASAHRPRISKPPDIVAEVGEDYMYPVKLALNLLDPPLHTRLRKIITPSFSPKRMARLEQPIRDISNELIDAFIEDGATDFVASYAWPFPVAVIALIVGAPPDAAARFAEWADALFALTGAGDLPEDTARRAWQCAIEFDRFTRGHVADRRQHPQDDLTSEFILMESADGEPKMTDEEVLHNIFGVLAAGADTSAILITNLLYCLLSYPDQWEAVKADPSLIPAAIEETVRYRSPVRGGIKVATEDVEIGGVVVPKGGRILMMMESSGRDADVFEEPDSFNIHRQDVREHLGFGIWTHFCVGAPLARLETRVALEQIIERLPGLRLAADQGPPEYKPSMILPSAKQLDVEWVADGGSR